VMWACAFGFALRQSFHFCLIEILSEIGFHLQQSLCGGRCLIGAQPLAHHFAKLSAIGLDFFEKRQSLVAQKEAADSAILGIGATLDQAMRFKAVNQTGDGNGLDLDKLSQLDLRQSGFVFQPSENDPLRPRHAMLAGKPVRSCAHESRHVIDQDQGIGLERV